MGNLKPGGEEGLYFGQSIFWRRGLGVLGQMTPLGVQRQTGGLQEGRGGNKLGSRVGAHRESVKVSVWMITSSQL